MKYLNIADELARDVMKLRSVIQSSTFYCKDDRWQYLFKTGFAQKNPYRLKISPNIIVIIYVAIFPKDHLPQHGLYSHLYIHDQNVFASLFTEYFS